MQELQGNCEKTLFKSGRERKDEQRTENIDGKNEWKFAEFASDYTEYFTS